MTYKSFLPAFSIIYLFSCSSNKHNELLYAIREAPIGGEYIRLKDSSAFEYGFLRSKEKSVGYYHLKSDTLFLRYSYKHSENAADIFIIKFDKLLPVGGKGTLLTITYNKLGKYNTIEKR